MAQSEYIINNPLNLRFYELLRYATNYSFKKCLLAEFNYS